MGAQILTKMKNRDRRKKKKNLFPSVILFQKFLIFPM